ncbi:MAG: hypothetical protein ACYTG7_23125 [Planctomycetota bacterium]|jgi:hypothetical protein
MSDERKKKNVLTVEKWYEKFGDRVFIGEYVLQSSREPSARIRAAGLMSVHRRWRGTKDRYCVSVIHGTEFGFSGKDWPEEFEYDPSYHSDRTNRGSGVVVRNLDIRVYAYERQEIHGDLFVTGLKVVDVEKGEPT